MSAREATSPASVRGENAADDKRQAILDAALELFAERGFYGSAVPLVAKGAGVGTGTVYRYFESKEALVNALYQQWKTAIGAFVLRDFDPQTPIREQFRTCWARMAEFARKFPLAYAFLELHHHGPYLDEKSLALEERLSTIARLAIERGQQEGLVKPVEPKALCALMLGAFCGLVKGWREGYYELEPKIVDATERCVWEALRL